MAIKKEIRERVYKKYEGRCAYCGEKISFKEMHVDHIFPKQKQSYCGQDTLGLGLESYYGKVIPPQNIDEINNLNPSCKVCNLWKSSWTIEQFRREIFRQIERLNKYSANFRLAKRYGLLMENVTPVIFYFEKPSRG